MGLGVIVEYSQPEGKSTETISCSGIYLGHGLVLTHGTVLVDIFKDQLSHPLVQKLNEEGFVYQTSESDLISETMRRTKSNFRIILPSGDHQRKPFIPSNLHQTSSDLLKIDPSSNDVKFQKSELLQHEPHHSLARTKYVSASDAVNKLSASRELVSPNYWSQEADPIFMFKQPDIYNSLISIMPASQGWKLTEEPEEKSTTGALETIIVSSFVVLKLSGDNHKEDLHINTMDDLWTAARHLMSSTATVCSKGVSVYVESSPFGSLSPGVFLNSLSHGIISNISGRKGDLLLTDARCIMGAEGAPVYVTEGQEIRVCGIVVSPFCWRHGEWLGLTLLASIRSVLWTLFQILEPHHDVEENCKNVQNRSILSEQIWRNYVKKLAEDNAKLIKNEDLLDYESNNKKPSDMEFPEMANTYLTSDISQAVDSTIVAVRCGHGWGSGVIVCTSPGIILTCAHVVHPAANMEVKIMLSGGKTIYGRVVHQTRPSSLSLPKTEKYIEQGTTMWDLAVVMTAHPLPNALSLASQIPPEGLPVIVAGHGIFSPSILPSPTLSRGIISRVITAPISIMRSSPHIYNSQDYIIPVTEINVNNYTLVAQKVSDEYLNQIRNFDDLKNHKTKTVKQAENAEGSNGSTSEGDQTPSGRIVLQSDWNGHIPVILQTSSAVYAGTSGGPVLALHPQLGWQVIGIMVCNTQDTANKATFPHINSAVPISPIVKIIQSFISSRDPAVLKYLDVECTAVSRLWALGLTPQAQL